MTTPTDNLRGVSFLVLGILVFSLQDIAVKGIGGDYPILEIVIFRSLTALPLTLLFFRFEGGEDCRPRGVPGSRLFAVYAIFSPTQLTLWAWLRYP